MQQPEKNQRSEDFEDDEYLYRIVRLGEKAIKKVKKSQWELKLLSEKQWHNLGIEQGNEWTHYAVFENEPYVLLFRKPLKKD